MADPLHARDELERALRLAAAEAEAFLASLDSEPARVPGADESAEAFAGPLPENGDGALAALRALVDGLPAATRSTGPRFFHFVTGGVTPAALAADWLTSALDQNAGMWVSSPLASRLEVVALDWLKDLFRLPGQWAGVLTTGATMANFAGLAAARRWWGERLGVDVEKDGLTGLPRPTVFASGYVHASAVKALSMLGIGAGSVRRLERDAVGRLDETALERELRALHGAPAILVATAGEVDAGDFDPVDRMAELAREHGAWLHVDGAFGLFARASPETAALANGVELADSVIADGHKWLNVPYDCGFAFVRDGRYLSGAFAAAAPYLPDAGASRPSWGFLGPEMSRRARSLAVWATLRAYGRAGYRELVERHVRLASRVAAQVRASDDLELLADPRLNVICFRAHLPGLDDERELDELNSRIGQAVVDDGRVLFGTTRYAGRVAFRPAIANWRTTEDDVDLIVPVVRELAGRIALRV